ncbi:MAG TPA: transcriptional activator RfaH [Xanthobacteraceae bacterium]|jgi:transcriptional antiterminator RfaH
MTTQNGSSWYVVHTRPREELKAFEHLRRQSYEVYLPRFAKKIRHARRVERVLRPFFPRYCFISLNLEVQGWRSIRSTVGVDDLVRFGEQPTPVPPGVIEELKNHEDADGCIGFNRQKQLKKGDKVVVLSGPFSRLLGLCESVSDDERISILLDLLGRKVRVFIETETVAAA